MTVQERLERLITELPESDLLVAERVLRGLKLTHDDGEDPLVAFLDNCPEDDEPYTEQERRTDEEAWARYQSGHWISHDEVIRRASVKVP